MTQDLIRYPIVDYSGDNGWRNTGEGGQFFYAVWKTAARAACSVDVEPELHMADVLVKAVGPLSEDFDAQKSRWSSLIDKEGYEAAWQESAVSFDTVLLLGTTRTSYFYDDYFYVKSTEQLTEAGRTIVQAISAAMGTEPTFVSYLDT